MPDTVNETGELAATIYKNLNMGSEMIVTLMPKIEDQNLKSFVTEQLAKYEKYSVKVKKLIKDSGEQTKEEPPFTKWMAKMGTQMNTMTDSSTSHLAEMLIQGSTMNVTDLLRKIHEAKSNDGGGEEISLAREVVSFEEGNIERYKEYL